MPITRRVVRKVAAVLAPLALGVAVVAAAEPGAGAASSVYSATNAQRKNDVVPFTSVPSVFGTGSAWRLPMSGTPVNGDSAAMVSNLASQVSSRYGGVAAFNYNKYNVSFYSVPADQPRADVVWDNCQGKSSTPVQLYDPAYGAHFVSVPIPADAQPAPGSDGQLTVWSPSSNQLWEFWQAHHESDGWHACWGGRIDKVSKAAGFFPNYTGASASGMAISGGALTLRDMEQGRADHALSLAIPDVATYTSYSYPAQRSDGDDASSDAIPEGTRFKLDPSVDVDSLPLTKIAKIVAHAAQDYGFIVTDRSGAVSVTAESSAGTVAAGGSDPYPSLLGGVPGYSQMQNFPWSKLQALPADYGKP